VAFLLAPMAVEVTAAEARGRMDPGMEVMRQNSRPLDRLRRVEYVPEQVGAATSPVRGVPLE